MKAIFKAIGAVLIGVAVAFVPLMVCLAGGD